MKRVMLALVVLCCLCSAPADGARRSRHALTEDDIRALEALLEAADQAEQSKVWEEEGSIGTMDDGIQAPPPARRTEEEESFVVTDGERVFLEEGLARAAALMEQGSAREASQIYAGLSASYPDNDALALAHARATMSAGNTETSLYIYDRLVAKNPDDTELLLEAARVHLAAGSTDEAMRLGGQVLEEYEKHRLQVRRTVRTGILHDSNANQGPASNTIRLGEWREVHVPGIEGKSTFGAYVGGGVNVGYRMSALSPWWLVGDLQGFARFNANSDLGESNSRRWHWGRAAGGVRYTGVRDLFEIRAKAEIFDYEFHTNVTSLGAELNYTRALTPRMHLILDAGLEQRAYNRSKDYDGTYFRAGGYARFLFPETGHDFLIGGGYVGASADFDDYGYDGWQALARANFRLPQGFTVSPQVSFTRESYNGPGTGLMTANRQDDRLRVGADVSYSMNENWSIEAGHHYTNNSSNNGMYDYDQHVTNLGMVWQW